MPQADTAIDDGAGSSTDGSHLRSCAAAITKRVAELLAFGNAAVDEIGRRAGNDAASALALLESISESTSGLLSVNLRLVPLMTSFQRSTGKNKWLRWFTGEQLEQEVFFADVCKQIEALAEDGQAGHAAMKNHVQQLTTQFKLMGTEIELLEADIAAARLLASPAYADQRAESGIGSDDLARLIRRTANLEAMVTATQLTRAQYQVAIQHAKSVSDRYREIRTLLLPIWKQSVGFDLFSRRVSTQID